MSGSRFVSLLALCLDLLDLFEYKFVNSRLVNSTFLHNKEGCPLDVTGTGEGAYMVYFVSFLGTLAVLPGNIVSALLMDKIGRLRMLGKGTRAGCWLVSMKAARAGAGCQETSHLQLWRRLTREFLRHVLFRGAAKWGWTWHRSYSSRLKRMTGKSGADFEVIGLKFSSITYLGQAIYSL